MSLFRRPVTSGQAPRGLRNSRRLPPAAEQQMAAAIVARDGEEETLAVLEDVDTGVEFYMDIIDRFALNGRNYIALFPLPDKRQTTLPELVILRVISGDGQSVNSLFESIRDRSELNAAFDAFSIRYERSIYSK